MSQQLGHVSKLVHPIKALSGEHLICFLVSNYRIFKMIRSVQRKFSKFFNNLRRNEENTFFWKFQKKYEFSNVFYSDFINQEFIKLEFYWLKLYLRNFYFCYNKLFLMLLKLVHLAKKYFKETFHFSFVNVCFQN